MQGALASPMRGATGAEHAKSLEQVFADLAPIQVNYNKLRGFHLKLKRPQGEALPRDFEQVEAR
jgi:hypothetical protein